MTGTPTSDSEGRGGVGTVDRNHLMLVGAGPGLGLAVARRFGVGGYRVTLVGRSLDRLGDLVGSLSDTGAEIGAMHFIGNEYVEVDGDSAYSETYFISYATITGSGQSATRSRGGRYLDRFERRDGEWKIVRRLLVDEWSRLDDLPTPPTPAGRVGLRSKDDPVYTFRNES